MGTVVSPPPYLTVGSWHCVLALPGFLQNITPFWMREMMKFGSSNHSIFCNYSGSRLCDPYTMLFAFKYWRFTPEGFRFLALTVNSSFVKLQQSCYSFIFMTLGDRGNGTLWNDAVYCQSISVSKLWLCAKKHFVYHVDLKDPLLMSPVGKTGKGCCSLDLWHSESLNHHAICIKMCATSFWSHEPGVNP